LPEPLFASGQALVYKNEQRGQTRAGLGLMTQEFELRVSQLLARKISRKAVHTTGDMTQVKPKRSPPQNSPNLFGFEAGYVFSQVFTNLEKAVKHRRNQWVHPWDWAS
jgi:hypothetical protein